MGLEIAAELIYLSSHQGQGRLCTQQRLHHQYHHDYYYYARTQHDDEHEIQLNPPPNLSTLRFLEPIFREPL